MSRWVVLVDFRDTAPPDEVQTWLEAADGVTNASASMNLPGSVGGSDAVWELPSDEVRNSPDCKGLLEAGCVATAELLPLDPVASGYRALEGPRVKRTLALTVRGGTPDEEIRRFEKSLRGMPAHIPEIASWALSRVRAGRSDPRFTHVWEQEYTDIDGLRVGYMRSPYHWTGVDRWFDPEMPCSIVQPQLAHMFCWADREVLTASP